MPDAIVLPNESNYRPRIARRLITRSQNSLVQRFGAPRNRAILVSGSHPAEMDPFWEIKKRFFLDRFGIPLDWVKRCPAGVNLAGNPIATFGSGAPAASRWARIRGRTYSLNPAFADEGWHWIRWIGDILNRGIDLGTSRQNFSRLQAKIRARSEKVYIFGTGPSLARAIERTWDDGIRLVCNTIVRDADLWNHLSPDAIVAGDGIYHFGCSDFALAFRSDLLRRMQERPVFFIYPAEYDVIVREELSDFAEYLVPIPVGSHRMIHGTVSDDFELPALENVLNLLLLPVACALSRNIGLWGFDGRAPNDKGFWKNSDKTFYPENLPQLQSMHPGFFASKLPKGAESSYVKSVHGEQLDELLTAAERVGFRFQMLHATHTETLKKRIT